jgi:uncharacterized membrane protein/predicted double-glycine peptidase
MLSLHNYANADAAVIKLSKQLGVKINPQEIIDELEKHPDYPSLLAISDVLSWFKINNVAYRVTSEELTQVQTPFIAHTNQNDDFVTINKIVDGSIYLSDDKRDHYPLKLDEFKTRFKGVVLVAQAPSENKNTTTQTWSNRFVAYKTPVAIAILGLSTLVSIVWFSPIFTSANWRLFAIVLFKTAGLITAILLLVQSIDKNNPWVQKFCSGEGKAGCNAILTSKAATIFKGLSWSEVGFFYFAGTWLALLFGANNTGILQALASLNVISLPYTLYSINYQARIAKQWCVFCTTVQALLWLEFTPLVGYFKTPFYFSERAVVETLICMVLPIAIWILLKPLLLKIQQLKTLKQIARTFIYNRQLFETSLKEQPKFPLPDEDWSIVLGNVEANTIITMVSNPYCPPCSIAHQELDEWLNRLDDIQLRIVFTANNNDHDRKTPITRHLMALNEQQDKSLVKKALHDWYEQKQKNYKEWAKTYPVILDESKYDKIEKQRNWCNVAEIKTTPTLLINGYRLPEAYRLHDIKYMLS